MRGEAMACTARLVGIDRTTGDLSSPEEEEMTRPNGVLAAAAEVERFCRRHKWRFCFIGGVAVQRWGEPRFTQDVDFTVLTELGTEEVFIDALLKQYTP